MKMLLLLIGMSLADTADINLPEIELNSQIKAIDTIDPERIAPSFSNTGLSFLVIGNWGNPNNIDHLSKVVGEMNVAASKSNPMAVITTGNNFYGPVNGVDDSKWQNLWTKMFTGRSGTLPFWASMGVNEWLGIDYKASINYMKESPRWVMLDFQYDRVVTNKAGLKAAFVFIDTSILYYDYAGINPIMAVNFHKAGLSQQNEGVLKRLKWIDDTLSKHQDKDYLFVVGHHTLKTCGYKNVTNMGNLNSLLRKWRVSAYIFGQKSAMQSRKDGEMTYIQVGSTGTVEPLCDDSNGWAKGRDQFNSVNTFGFGNLKINAENALFEFIDSSGAIIHSEKIQRKSRTDTIPRGLTVNASYSKMELRSILIYFFIMLVI